jgi:drug/metabolite transporter (DMT)-like permease
MRQSDLIRLLSLAAIWGASFLFMRLLAPVLGPLWTAEVRAGIAGCVLLLWMRMRNNPLAARIYWKQYLTLGVLNSALPFTLYSFAALSLPSGYSAILNATSPLWGALIGAIVLGEALNARKLSGMVVGVIGVALLVRLGPLAFGQEVVLAVLACLLATLCYGLAGVYSKKQAQGMTPLQMSAGSQLTAALVILPFVGLAPVRGAVTVQIVLLALGLAVICSAFAYILYYRLIADLGPTKALTVTFLIPLFALIWGAVFLHESLTVSTLIGCAAVVLATWLVVFSARR